MRAILDLWWPVQARRGFCRLEPAPGAPLPAGQNHAEALQQRLAG
jgi:hypothetical protein